MKNNKKNNKKGFTLLELLIVFGILSVLGVIAVVFINPVERFRETYDSKRMSELKTLTEAISAYRANDGSLSAVSSTVVYVSLPDSDDAYPEECDEYNLPPAPIGYTYRCVLKSNYRKVDGNGWIPLNLSQQLGSLPVDPDNDQYQYYTFTSDGTDYEINAVLSSLKYQPMMASDGGDNNNLYEKGSKLTLSQASTWQIAKNYPENQTVSTPSFLGDKIVYAAGSAGEVAFFIDANHINGNSGFYWDNSNEKLGIGTSYPKGKLDVAGGISVGSYAGVNTPPSNGMIISGNIGIGTTTPAEKLTVAGNILGTGSLSLSSLTSGSILFAGANGILSQDNSNLYWDNTNKRLGIGITTPEGKTHIKFSVPYGTTQKDLPFGLLVETDNQISGAIGFKSVYDGQTGYGRITYDASNMRFNFWGKFNGVDYPVSFGIPAEGNIIWGGVVTPGRITRDSEGLKLITESGNGIYLQTNSDNSQKVMIPYGKVGIGTSTPSRKLFVNGDAGGTSGWYNDSDIALKKDIYDMGQYGLSTIMNLRPVNYKIKTTGEKQIGLIAQEVKPLIPEIVSGAEGRMGIDYAKLTPILIKAIQQQQQQIEELKKINKNLQLEIEILKEKVK